MLESLIVRNIATYDNTGAKILDLKKVNFIYGTNSSGKTTITKLIADPTNACFANCQVAWKHNLPMSARVYNKDFRDKNFGKGSIDGVFTLGQATRDENQLQQIELNEKTNSNTKLDLEKFSSLLKTLSSQFVSNKELLKAKQKEPSRSFELTSTEEQLIAIANTIEEANNNIRSHNLIVLNFSNERTKLISAIWKCLTDEHRKKIEGYNKKRTGLNKGIENTIERRYQCIRFGKQFSAQI
jgi:wobble nucleotide-excising tRNase